MQRIYFQNNNQPNPPRSAVPKPTVWALSIHCPASGDESSSKPRRATKIRGSNFKSNLKSKSQKAGLILLPPILKMILFLILQSVVWLPLLGILGMLKETLEIQIACANTLENKCPNVPTKLRKHHGNSLVQLPPLHLWDVSWSKSFRLFTQAAAWITRGNSFLARASFHNPTRQGGDVSKWVM